MEKEQVRKEVFIIREQANREDIDLMNDRIFNNFKNNLKQILNIENSKVGGYYNFEKEASILNILKFYKINNNEIYLPVCNEEMLFREWNDLSIKNLKQNKKFKNNILLEPNGKQGEPSIIFCPCVAVDLQGNRVGYGKGFYDRYLTNKKCIKICVVFNFQIFKEIKMEYFDVKMDYILSENKIIKI